MDKKFDITMKMEIKLMESIEENRIQNKQLNESEIRLKQSINESQRLDELYRNEVQKCRQLSELLEKSEFETKIAIEKHAIDANEDKRLSSNQINRLEEQLTQLRHELSALQTKCLDFEHKWCQTHNRLEKQKTYKLTIGSELTQIQNRSDSLSNYLKSLDQNQCQLKHMVNSTNDLNTELEKLLKERKDELIGVQRENSSLRNQLNGLSAQTMRARDALNERELQSLRLTQQNDLLKQELNAMREQLKKAIEENSALNRKLVQNNLNSVKEFEN